MGHIQRRVLFLAFLMVGALGFLAGLHGKAQNERYYLSGMLVFGEHNGCGLVRINVIDRSSCHIPEEFCSRHSQLLNQRIRISAQPTQCSDPDALRCDQSADFYEAGFQSDRCFSDPSLVSVLKL